MVSSPYHLIYGHGAREASNIASINTNDSIITRRGHSFINAHLCALKGVHFLTLVSYSGQQREDSKERSVIGTLCVKKNPREKKKGKRKEKKEKKKRERKGEGDRQPREGEGGATGKEVEGGGQPSTSIYHRESLELPPSPLTWFCNIKLPRLKFSHKF